jgi:uncharacterized low-complexity protein
MASVADSNMGTAMMALARLVAAAGIVVAMAGPAMSQDAPRATPETDPAARSVGTPSDEAARQGDQDQGKVEAEGSGEASKAGPGGCPYIKRKLELIV